ncbi:MAG: BMP family ABC transporter substrate-binding protein, partial [Lachnospiraceae bacterium]|nr:BMP family ABC transporter substrate-binding protein [Lachnospiraceae bacterium]
LAKDACRDLIKKWPKTDILAMHTNSLAPNRFAEEKGIWSIGFNLENADMFPDSYLTSCVWKWDKYYKDAILSCLKGKFYGSVDWVSMEDGIVQLSDLTKNCVPGTEEAVEKARQLFVERSFDVFYGPIIDNKGKLRIPEGESMSEDEMRNHFDWYVEGVTVEK